MYKKLTLFSFLFLSLTAPLAAKNNVIVIDKTAILNVIKTNPEYSSIYTRHVANTLALRLIFTACDKYDRERELRVLGALILDREKYFFTKKITSYIYNSKLVKPVSGELCSKITQIALDRFLVSHSRIVKLWFNVIKLLNKETI